MVRRIKAIALTVIGLIALIMGGSCNSMGKQIGELDDGSSGSSYTYGGDAYTGIQNAAAKTANNVQDAIAVSQAGFRAVLKAFGSVLTVAGLAFLCIGGCGMYEEFVEPALAKSTASLPETEVEGEPVEHTEPDVKPVTPSADAQEPKPDAAAEETEPEELKTEE